MSMSKVKLSVYVPEELHRKAKYASFERGTTIQHLVEIALERSLDPTQSATPTLKPKEVQTLVNQFRQLLQSGNELYIASTSACIRGTYGLLQADRRVTDLPHPAPGEAVPGDKTKGKRTRLPTTAAKKIA